MVSNVQTLLCCWVFRFYGQKLYSSAGLATQLLHYHNKLSVTLTLLTCLLLKEIVFCGMKNLCNANIYYFSAASCSLLLNIIIKFIYPCLLCLFCCFFVLEMESDDSDCRPSLKLHPIYWIRKVVIDSLFLILPKQ